MHTQSEDTAFGRPQTEPAERGGEPIDSWALLSAVAADEDRAAFAALFEHFGPRMKTLAMRMGADASAAEEIVQDTFLAVWRGAKTYDPARSALSTWIYAAARNGIIDRLRKQPRPDLRPCDLALDIEQAPHAEAETDTKRAAGRLRAALTQLPGEQAAVPRTFYFEGKSHGRIAEELDLPLGTVKSRIRLAMDRLKSALQAKS